MGYANFYFFFDSSDELDRCLDRIVSHNLLVKNDDSSVGMMIYNLLIQTVERPLLRGSQKGKFCLNFGNNGGHYETVMYLLQRGCKIHQNTTGNTIKKRLGDRDPICVFSSPAMGSCLKQIRKNA